MTYCVLSSLIYHGDNQRSSGNILCTRNLCPFNMSASWISPRLPLYKRRTPSVAPDMILSRASARYVFKSSSSSVSLSWEVSARIPLPLFFPVFSFESTWAELPPCKLLMVGEGVGPGENVGAAVGGLYGIAPGTRPYSRKRKS